MTLGSCRVKKEDSVGAGPQNMFVNLFLMAQYAGPVNLKVFVHTPLQLQPQEACLHHWLSLQPFFHVHARYDA